MAWLNRARKLQCGILFCCLLALRSVALDILVEIDGIPGEVQDKAHPATISVSSFQLGASNPTSGVIGGGAGTGKVSFTDITFTKSLDKASPPLYLACAKGTHIAKVTFYVRIPGATAPKEFYKIVLQEVIVTGVQTSASAGDDRPTESISLAFTKIEFDYFETKPDGSLSTTPVKSTWNVAANTP